MSDLTNYLPEEQLSESAPEAALHDDSLNESAELLGLNGGGEAKASRVPTGLILMAVVLAVAAGALYAMRLGGTSRIKQDAGAISAENKIKQALATLVGQSTESEDRVPAEQRLPDTGAVIARFANDPTDKQVRVDQLKKNPFTMRRPEFKENDAAIQQVSQQQYQRDQQMRKLRQEAESYVLQTVMNGRTPMAVVSGKVVREGDRLGNFRVAAIETLSVMLTAQGNTYKLTLNPVSKAND